MSIGKVAFPQWNMRKQLSHLWQIAFEDSPGPTKYFFNNNFKTKNCLVYQIGEKAVAMVHMLPAQVSQNKFLVQAHYIYAAATLPEYRSKGYMGKLIRAAAAVGKNRGDKYSFILPANEGLYEYYGKFDYSKYFEIKFLTLSRKELSNFAAAGTKNNAFLKSREIGLVRNAQLVKQKGSVIWNTKAISYAVKSNKLYGGKFICSKRADKLSYALCRRDSKGNCEIMEIIADIDTIADLSANLLYNMPAENYRFRLPNYSKLYNGAGEFSPYGMLKPLDHITQNEIEQNTKAPYLGFTLD